MLALSDYHTVIALLELRHFGRAAARLGVSQPALTVRLQRIEAHVGTRLFERGRQGARPTAAGLTFGEGARRVIEAAEAALASSRDAALGYGETLSIGTTQIAALGLAIDVLTRFRAEQPRARIRLTEANTSRLEGLIEARVIDVALLHPPVHSSALTERLLRRGRLVSLDLSAESGPGTFVSYPRSEAPVLMGRIGRERAEAASLGEADTMLGALTLSRAGYGTCVVEESYARSVLAGDMAGLRPRRSGALATSVVWRRTDRRAIVRAFLACCVPSK
ncbi:MAG: LysR family transcriptional regulator [Hyphomicrobiaceae bacterium]|nr:LysR family transcriptional regulator [Hyphomicrobiaceae bacterium]